MSIASPTLAVDISRLTCIRDGIVDLRVRSSEYHTEVQLGNNKLQYGTIKIADAVNQALGPACTEGGGACYTGASSLVVSTEIFQTSEKTSKNAQLTFAPKSTWTGDMGSNYVDASANTASSVQTSEHHDWITPTICTGTECPPVSNSADFYYGPDLVTIVRRANSDDSIVDQFTFSVTLNVEGESQAEVWCTLGSAAAAITGAFNGALAAVFGIAELAACG